MTETGTTMEVDLQAIATWVLGHDTAETRRAAAKWVTDLLETAMVAPSPDDTGRSTMSDRVLDLIDTELVRLGDGRCAEPLAWWEFRQRRWRDGVLVARETAAGHLREIRDAYIADALTREAEDLGLYAEPVPVVEPPTDSAFTRCPFCSYILPPGSIIGGKPEPLAVPTTEDPRG